MNSPIIDEDIRSILDHPLPWNEFEGSSVLISGGAGMLPSYMVETLLSLALRGYGPRRIICIVRSIDKARSRFIHHLQNPILELISADVTEPLNIEGPIDFIIHAASQASPKFYSTDPVGTMMANIIGTRNLLDFGRTKDIKSFLFFSSSEVYGSVESGQIPIKEEDYGYLDPTQVRSCYSESKRVGETMCVAWGHQYKMRTIIVRPFHTFGPGLALNDGRVFGDFVSDIVNRRNIVIKGDGKTSRAFCYIADATAGYFTALLKGEHGRAYNIGGDSELSIMELSEKLIKAFKDRRLSVTFDRSASDDKLYLASKVNRVCPDITRIKQLGWKPHTDIEHCFKRTVAHHEWQH